MGRRRKDAGLTTMQKRVLSSAQHVTEGGTTKGYLVTKDIMHMIFMGYSKNEILDEMEARYGILKVNIHNYYKAALAAIDERIAEYGENVVKKNLCRIEAIIDESYEKGDTRTTLQAIDILNKMSGAYVQKIDVNADKPIFEIKIGE